MDSGEIKPAVQQTKGMASKLPLEWLMFGITFSAAFLDFLSQRLCCSQGEEPFSPCFPSKPQPEVTNDALRKRQIKVQIAQFERKRFIFPPILSEDGLL